MRKQATPEQKIAAAEKRARLQAMSREIAALTDAQRAAIVAHLGAVPTCEGHPLSVHNSCLLLAQKPETSLVGGFNQWRAVGRQVSKGARALFIIIPKAIKDDGDAEPGKPAFLLGCVFDITQTEEENSNDLSSKL